MPPGKVHDQEEGSAVVRSVNDTLSPAQMAVGVPEKFVAGGVEVTQKSIPSSEVVNDPPEANTFPNWSTSWYDPSEPKLIWAW